MNASLRQPLPEEAKKLLRADLEKLFPLDATLPAGLCTLLERIAPKPPPKSEKN